MIGFVFGRGGIDAHAADRIARLRRGYRRRGLGEVTLGLGLELGPAAGAAELVSAAGVHGTVFGRRRIDGHAAHGVLRLRRGFGMVMWDVVHVRHLGPARIAPMHGRRIPA